MNLIEWKAKLMAKRAAFEKEEAERKLRIQAAIDSLGKGRPRSQSKQENADDPFKWMHTPEAGEILANINVAEDRKQWYHEIYLKSDHWKEKRAQIMERAHGMCESCHIKAATEVHHLTYKNMWHESNNDLIALCRSCHEKHHSTKEVIIPVSENSKIVEHMARHLRDSAERLIEYDAVKHRGQLTGGESVEVRNVIKKETGQAKSSQYWFYDIYSGEAKRKQWTGDSVDVVNMILENIWKDKKTAMACCRPGNEKVCYRLISEIRYKISAFGRGQIKIAQEKDAIAWGYEYKEAEKNESKNL